MALSSVFERVLNYLALNNSFLDFLYFHFTKAFDFE